MFDWLNLRPACAQAPIFFSLVEQGAQTAEQKGVRLRAVNKHFFASTAGLLLNWRLVLDGAPLPIGDVLSQSPSGWHPGGDVLIGPQASSIEMLHMDTGLRCTTSMLACAVLKAACVDCTCVGRFISELCAHTSAIAGSRLCSMRQA